MSVERATRLRRYLRKDYTQIVEFPVEIVGRDGLVRRYSFDDSVRLYQRRIHSAPMRYDDGDLVDAEVRHCRQRIDQLRRSYLEHFGWGPLRDGQLGGLFAGPLAAEVAAFLRRAFVAEREGPTTLRLTLVESGLGDTCFVRCPETGRSWMLYAWRIDADGPRGARQAWRDTLARLATAPAGTDVERLLLASEGPDIALVLAGSGEWAGPVAMGPEDDPEPGTAPDPLHAGVRALYDGRADEALRLLEAGLDAQPGRLVLAQATALVALLEGESERAEFAARYGRLQRPDDVLLGYLLAVALCRLGRVPEAAEIVREAAAEAPRSSLLALLSGVVALREGRLVRAWRALGVAAAAGAKEPRYASRAAGVLRGTIARAASGIGAAGAAFAAGGVLAAGAELPLAGVAILVSGLVVGGASIARLVAVARAAVSGNRLDGVPRLVSLELLPREREMDGN